MKNMIIRDRIRGSLVAGAAGDALGYRVEFHSYAAIVNEFGEGGIRAYASHWGESEAVVSDDTQMTLFTADGILCHTADMQAGGAAMTRTEYVFRAYLDWFATQTGRGYAPDAPSFLMREPQLFVRRAPGNTSLSALAGGRMGSIDRRINHSKGCGGVMRVAPLGLMAGEKLDDRLCVEGAEYAAITHGHTLGYVPAAMLTHIVARAAYRRDDALTLEEIVQESIGMADRMFDDDPEYGRAVVLLRRALQLAQNDQSDLMNIRELGEGWVGEEALAIAVYCCLRHADDFSAALIASVNHDGDSDSTGAVTGNILGAYIGYDAIPDPWKTGLQLSSLLLETADDLFAAGCILAGGAADDAFMAKYAGRSAL